MNLLVKALTGLFMAAVLTLPVAAQEKRNEDASTRSVEGVVSDNSGPVSGAVVQLKDTKTLQVRSFVTQKDGAYHFYGLSTNTDYELHATYQGTSSGTKTLTVFNTRKKAVVDLKLK